ncbi:MAG: hypothetical protein HOQ22_14540 [Nocardioidaceae bacterium]|nr:hypothetical protein [Nocardioidaceae bacterium]NUS52243.1 hypothetical protein [Nocardioidaceae bacterium]
MTRRSGLVLVLAVLALALSGCVSLPRDGSVRTVSVSDRGESDTLVDYTPSGPEKGSAPVPLVDGWLDAMRATPLNTFVARQFLSANSRGRWVPEKGTLVYGSKQLISRPGGRVLLRLDQVRALDERGSWLGDPTQGRGTTIDLRLVRDGGEWRIANPPDRLVIPESHFDGQYQQYFLYFFDKTAQVLVPEPVYVPRGLQTPTLLVSGLLKGPQQDLADVERTFVPRGTALDGISVPVSRDGTAEVPLSDKVLDVDDGQLNLIFAQLAWTLGQVSGLERMRVTVDGTPVDLPGARLDVSVGQWSQFDPAVAWASTSMFGLRQGRVAAVDDGKEKRVTGAFGALPVGLRSIGVDLPAQRIAAVSSDGHRVLEADRDRVPGRSVGPDDVRTLYAGGTNLLPPDYDLYGQLFVVDRTSLGAELSVIRAGVRRAVEVPGITGRTVQRFALSRDGTRLVFQVRTGSADRLYTARVRRDSSGRVRGVNAAQALPLTGAGVREIKDMDWRTPGSLAVLAGQRGGTSQVLIVKVDGSSSPEDLSTDAELFRDQAASVTTSPAVGSPLYIGTASGQLFSLATTGRWTGTSIDPGLAGTTFVG